MAQWEKVRSSFTDATAEVSVKKRPTRESMGVLRHRIGPALIACRSVRHSVDHHTFLNLTTRRLEQEAVHMREFSVTLTYPGLSDHEDFVRSLGPRHPCLASDPSHFPLASKALPI